MQVNSVNSTYFGSVHLPYKNIPLSKPLDKIKPYFELKGFGNSTPAKAREEINLGQAGVLTDKDGIYLIGKDREADKFIARQIKEGNIEHTYIEDTPETNFDGPVFEILG